jgi:hypothetical protein
VTYALLIYRASPPDRPVPELEERGALEGHRALQAAASARQELHSVARLDDTRVAHTVRRVGSAHQVSDGPYIETKEWLVGFYVLDCATEAEALARAASLCDANHAIEVRPVTWRWQP